MTAATSAKAPWPSSTQPAILRPSPSKRATGRQRASPQSPPLNGALSARAAARSASTQTSTTSSLSRLQRSVSTCGRWPRVASMHARGTSARCPWVRSARPLPCSWTCDGLERCSPVSEDPSATYAVCSELSNEEQRGSTGRVQLTLPGLGESQLGQNSPGGAVPVPNRRPKASMSRRSGPAEDRMRRLGGIAPVPMAAQQLKGQLWLTWARTCAVRQPAGADDLPVLRELDSEEPERRRWMGEDRLGQLLDRRAPIVTDPPVGRHPRVSLAPQLAEDRRLARSPRPQHQPRGSSLGSRGVWSAELMRRLCHGCGGMSAYVLRRTAQCAHTAACPAPARAAVRHTTRTSISPSRPAKSSGLRV